MGTLLIKRYLWLIDLLTRCPNGLTLKEINAEWERSSLYNDCGGREISRATLRNHCNDINDIWKILIKCEHAGGNSHYLIKKEGKDEFEQNTKWLLSSIATSEFIAQSKDISDKILFEEPDSGFEYLNTISIALRNNTILSIEYQSFHIGSPKQKGLLVEPLCLKMFKRRWYMLCRRCSDMACRIYALDRLQKCELTSEHFTYPEGFSPKEYFAPYYGISTDGYGEECSVILKAYRELPKYLEAQPIHYSQKIKERNSEYTVFEYRMIPAFDFVQEIMLHAEQLEVLEPEWLRQIVKEKSAKISELYR